MASRKSVDDGCLPCELLPDAKINEPIDFSETMTAMCVEIKDVEAPRNSLSNCQSHSFFLIQLIFRFAKILRNKKRPCLVACSLVEPCSLVEDSIRGSLTSGYLFWLFFPVTCVKWFRVVVQDLAMINNGYHGKNDIFAVDFNPDLVTNIDDIDDAGEKCDKMSSKRLTSQFQLFDLVRGSAPETMSRRSLRSSEPAVYASLIRLEDLDKCIELYFTFNFTESNRASRLPSNIREMDSDEAWLERLRLLSPGYLFRSSRRAAQRRELVRLARKAGSETVFNNDNDDESVRRTMLEMSRVDNAAARCFMTYARQTLESCVLENSGTVVNMTQFVAWRLEAVMLEPTYFVDRLFPSVTFNDPNTRAFLAELRGIEHNDIDEELSDHLNTIGHLYLQKNMSKNDDESISQFEHKNPAIVHIGRLLKMIGMNPETYANAEKCRSFFTLYNETHFRGNLPMSIVIKTSYRDAEENFSKSKGFASRCLNALVSTTTNARVPFVYNSLRNVPLVYQVLFSFLRLVANATGVWHTLVELLFTLFSALHQLKPHKSMSLHAVLLGPPGTGKSRLLNVAKAIVGERYVNMVTYRTAKSNLVANAGDQFESSKKMRFMSEFVPPGNGDKNNPLSNESSQEATAMKEELDTGITKMERVEKTVDLNTGRSSHRNVFVHRICDNANILAMNENNFCPALISRFVTFEVPQSDTVVAPREHDAFDAKLQRYNIPRFYSAVRHIVMETARLNELKMYPRRHIDDDVHDDRGFVLVWDKISDVCEEIGVVYGLKHNIRVRQRCFTLAKLISELSAIFTVYGCPPKCVWDQVGDVANFESRTAFNDQLIEGHIKWLGEQPPKTLHDEVVAESALDPADVLFSFSMMFQFIQKERRILRALIDHLVDPTRTCYSRDDQTAFFTLPKIDTLPTMLERKTGLSAKTIKDTLRTLESFKVSGGDHYALREMRDSGRFWFENDADAATNCYLLHARYAADIFAAENEDRVRELSAHLQTIIRHRECGETSGNYIKLTVDSRYKRDLFFLRHFTVRQLHLNRARRECPSPVVTGYFLDVPVYHPPEDDMDEGRYEVIVYSDFYESRLQTLREILCEQLRNKTAVFDGDGFTLARFSSKDNASQFHDFTSRLVTGEQRCKSLDTQHASSRVKLIASSRQRQNGYNVHIGIFHPSLNDTVGVDELRTLCLHKVECSNNAFTAILATNLNQAAIEIINRTGCFWQRLHLEPCVKCIEDDPTSLRINVSLLNEIRPIKTVSSSGSLMRLIVERTVFRNMTEREQVVYVDKCEEDGGSERESNPFGVFRALDVAELAEKNGGQLPEHSCKNPFKDQRVRNATTDAIDGVQIRSGCEIEPDKLTLNEGHVTERKSLMRAIASGEEIAVANEIDHIENTKEKQRTYNKRLKEILTAIKKRNKNKYKPIQCYRNCGEFPQAMVTEGASRWEPYVSGYKAKPRKKKKGPVNDDYETRMKKSRQMFERITSTS